MNQTVSLAFDLYPNYPNPFNSITTITYSLLQDCQVKIDIFNLIGERMATLVDEEQKMGLKTVKWDAQNHSNGMYFYRLQAEKFTKTRKMIFLK